MDFYKRISIILVFLSSHVCAELPTELLGQQETILESTRVAPLPNWTILVYMEADNSLASFAARNISSMCKAPSCSNVNLLVQWNKPASQKTYRLKIINNQAVDVGSLNQVMGLAPNKELSSAINWMKASYPANHYMIVLWNHGGGIDKLRRNWLRPLCFDNLESLEQIAALNTQNAVDDDERGILYNDTYNTYLTIAQMKKVFDDGMVCLNQQIDIVGMDACLMAMIEICYAMRNSTKIFVGSENVEMGDGWNYTDIMANLVKANGNLSPEELAKLIVTKYQWQYLQSDPSFTQSAINIARVTQIKDSLNQIVQDIQQLNNLSHAITSKLVSTACGNSISFNKDYVDISNFCDKLYALSSSYISFYQKNLKQPLYQQVISVLTILQKDLIAVKRAIQDAVISSVSGVSISDATGLSIYLPNLLSSNIRKTYFQSDFAQNSLWGTLLTMFNSSRNNELLNELLNEGLLNNDKLEQQIPLLDEDEYSKS